MIDIKDFQLSLDDLDLALSKFSDDGSVLTVGVHEENNARKEEGATNADIGAYNQFGTKDIPPRPFLDIGVMSGVDEYDQALNEREHEDLEDALKTIGVLAQGAVRSYMTDLQEPPNAPGTIKKKGSSNPLIDTGELRASITWVVSKETITEGL